MKSVHFFEWVIQEIIGGVLKRRDVVEFQKGAISSKNVKIFTELFLIHIL